MKVVIVCSRDPHVGSPDDRFCCCCSRLDRLRRFPAPRAPRPRWSRFATASSSAPTISWMPSDLRVGRGTGSMKPGVQTFRTAKRWIRFIRNPSAHRIAGFRPVRSCSNGSSCRSRFWKAAHRLSNVSTSSARPALRRDGWMPSAPSPRSTAWRPATCCNSTATIGHLHRADAAPPRPDRCSNCGDEWLLQLAVTRLYHQQTTVAAIADKSAETRITLFNGDQKRMPRSSLRLRRFSSGLLRRRRPR